MRWDLVFKVKCICRVQQISEKRNFIAKSVLTNTASVFAAKTKNTLKNIFFGQDLSFS